MKPFNHVNAYTVNQAVKILKNSRGKARIIAGGTDLLGSLKDKILPEYPKTIVNIKTIRNLDYIREDSRGLKIGALARLYDIARSPAVRERYGLLADASESVGAPQIRHMGTAGGNLCQDVRCWYYRYPDHIGGQIPCYLKGGKICHAMTGENRYHSVFGGVRAGDPPCRSACPGGIDIPSCLGKVRDGDLHDAARMLLDSNPMPSITGRVCPHFCQQQCNRRGFDETVSVRDIERSMGDYILEHAGVLMLSPEKESGKGVAIIGSGPAGLSAAFYIRRAGHQVTVFDRMADPGEMLTNSIRDKRLPLDIARRSVQAIEDMGVEFRLKVDIANDLDVKRLQMEFDALLIAADDEMPWAPSDLKTAEGGDSLIASTRPYRILKSGGKGSQVIDTIASGKRAAVAMNQYLGGAGEEAEGKDKEPIARFATFNTSCLQKTIRPGQPDRIAETSVSGLKEIQAEANRCFNCSCVSVNVSDIGLALVALDARIRTAGTGGVRTIPISEFFGAMRNSLKADEMVTEIRIPRPPPGTRQMFLKYRLREAIDFAVLSLASVITLKDGYCKEARIALGGAAPRPFRLVEAEQALKGKAVNSDTIETAAEASVAGAIPLAQNAYKLEIIRSLVKRALSC